MLPSVWFTLLVQNGVHWTYWPKSTVISVIVLLNYPFVLLERLIFKNKIRSIQITEPVFIIGHPRSGTTFLHYLLSNDQRFTAPSTLQSIIPNTFLLFGWIFRPFFKFAMPKKRPMDDMAMGPDLPKEEEFGLINMTSCSFAGAFYFPKRIDGFFSQTVLFENDTKMENIWKKRLSYLVKKISFSGGNRQILLKSPYNTARIKHILETFPDAKFIHIHRHPARVYFSTRKLLQLILPILSLQKPKGEHLEKFIRNSYPKLYEAYFRDVGLIKPENFFELSFEDLIKDPMAKLQEVYAHFNWNSFEETREALNRHLDEVSGHRVGKYDDDAETLEDLGEEWKSISRRLGYP